MLGNIAKNILLLQNKSILFKRYNVSQLACNITSKYSTGSSKDQCTTSKTDGDDDSDQPIKYSSSKAATMRANEYRDPYGDKVPWYQSHMVFLSITVFLIYFCILREENDIDLILNNELGDSLNQFENKLVQRKTTGVVSN